MRPAHLGERLGFVDGEPPGAGEMQEEQVILHQIAAERRFRQIAAGESQHEIVPRIGRPARAGSGDQAREQSVRHPSAEQHVAGVRRQGAR